MGQIKRNMSKIRKDIENFNERLTNYEPYPDGEVTKAVKIFRSHIFDQSEDLPKIMWLHKAQKKDFNSFDTSEAREKNAKFVNRWFSGLYGLGREGYNLNWKMIEILGEEVREIASSIEVPVLNREISMVNRSQLIATRMRHLAGPITTSSEWFLFGPPAHLYSQSCQSLQRMEYPFRKSLFFGKYFVEDEAMKKLLQAVKVAITSLYAIIPVDHKLLLVERPKSYKHGRNLHREDGPAIHFPKLDCGIYCLNNVTVPKEVVLTPPEELNPRLLQTTRNAEVRREIVRKVGIDRIIEKLEHEILDTQGDYQLINLPLGDGRDRPYLRMLNPSIGEWHVEGVSPWISTVEEALAWRNQTDRKPAILT